MSQYYAAIIRATRSSARAIQTIATISRQIRYCERVGNTTDAAMLYDKLIAAQRRYARAQAILDSHPLSAADIAARQADYPKARD